MILAAAMVAQGWLDLRTVKLTKKERALGEWANEALEGAIYHDADYAFEILEAIHAADVDQVTIDEFAAGPVEAILAYQGVFVIDRIEEKARRDPKFASVLRGVWQNSISDPIWERVKSCR